jgi:Double-GTPase 2
VKCPACFRPLPATPKTMRCVGPCAPKVDPGASAARGYEVYAGPVMRVESAPAPGQAPVAVCDGCQVPSSSEACPHCSFPVPNDWRSSRVTCIALAGARATGKSLLIAVSTQQLGLLVERFWGSEVRGAGDTQRRFDQAYLTPLLEERRLMDPTRALHAADSITREPLIFQFNRPVDGRTVRQFLVLRDVAGEDLEHDTGNDSALDFFSRADAVLVLIDPLKVRQIRDMLADIVPEPALIGGESVDVLRYVLGLMTSRVPGARTKIPIAVVLSKVDVLQKLSQVTGTKWAAIMDRPGSPLQRDPSLMTPHYDDEDGRLLHAEVDGLLEMLGALAIRAMLRETADTYRFFAASALGESPDGDMVHSGGIAPFRALDPIKWALHVQA